MLDLARLKSRCNVVDKGIEKKSEPFFILDESVMPYQAQPQPGLLAHLQKLRL